MLLLLAILYIPLGPNTGEAIKPV